MVLNLLHLQHLMFKSDKKQDSPLLVVLVIYYIGSAAVTEISECDYVFVELEVFLSIQKDSSELTRQIWNQRGCKLLLALGHPHCFSSSSSKTASYFCSYHHTHVPANQLYRVNREFSKSHPHHLPYSQNIATSPQSHIQQGKRRTKSILVWLQLTCGDF